MNTGLSNGLRAAGFRGRIQAEEPLARYTTWRIGGPAELLVHPVDVDDLGLALAWARSIDLPWRVMGNGSNLLVRDEGVRGMVLRIRRVLDDVESDGDRWDVGAGASFPGLARRTAEAGRTGLEFGTGIPGTLGGAIVMNAGWHEFEVGAAVHSVRVLDVDGSPREIPVESCEFSYRSSRFRGGREIVVAATLQLEEADSEEVRARVESFADSRKRNQPTELASCGSVFLKPSGDFAGRLIDEAGLKGRRVGELEVSPKHANFFVNHGNGTAGQALELIEQVEEAVLRRFAVRLEREFELW